MKIEDEYAVRGRIGRARRGGRLTIMSARTYRAATMKEALAQVRRDLGGGAVILGAREVRRRRMFGLRTRELVEVTASDGRTPPASVIVPGAVAPPAASSGVLHAHFGEQLSRLHAMVE